MKGDIVVLMGGWSHERAVSMETGKICAQALKDAGYRVREVILERDIQKLLQALTPAPDVVFNALHGQFGEDGGIQSILDFLNIPYTHSGVGASAVGFDKVLCLKVFQSVGIPIAQSIVVEEEDVRKANYKLPFDKPYVIKPSLEGSSVGVFKIESAQQEEKLKDWCYGRALVEQYIPGRELTVVVLEGKALVVTEIFAKGDFYDYKSKYEKGQSYHTIPAQIPKEIEKKCMDYAVLAHKTLGCVGVTRTDFRYDDVRYGLVGLEINTHPGMTSTSHVPEQAAFLGISLPELCAQMVESARCQS